MTWDPDSYPTTIRAEIHDYDELQEQVAQATQGMSPRTILDLGTGAGETAARVLHMHPASRLVGIDSSAEMLRGAAERLPEGRFELLQQDLDTALPNGQFDLVVSALAVHHLKGASKAKLFRSIAQRLTPGGRFVMGDVVVPEVPSDAVIDIEPGYDFPSTIADQLKWMSGAGLSPEVLWVRKDLVVLKAERRL